MDYARYADHRRTGAGSLPWHPLPRALLVSFAPFDQARSIRTVVDSGDNG